MNQDSKLINIYDHKRTFRSLLDWVVSTKRLTLDLKNVNKYDRDEKEKKINVVTYA